MKAIHLFAGMLLLGATARGTSILYTVTLNTSDPSFSQTPPGPLSLAFQLADGSATGDGNNAAIFSNFQFSGGSASGVPTLIGSASGNLSSGATLTDAGPANIFFQGFTAGSSLSFNLLLTTNVDPGTPDELIFSILDSTLSPVPTNSPSPLFPLFAISIDSLNPTVQTFGSLDQETTAGGLLIFGAPAVTAATSMVPEPSTVWLCGLVLTCAGFLLLRGRRDRPRRRA